MPRETGSPEAQVLLYAIQRGEYDKDLARLAHAINRRRENADRIGMILASIGDIIEVWDDENAPEAVRGARLMVVDYLKDGRYKARLQANTTKYERGVYLGIREDWVYRVHYTQ